MKRIIAAFTVMVALALVAPAAQAETYSSNNLSNGVNSVCSVTYGHGWYGQYFGYTQIGCSDLGPITVKCVANNNGFQTSQGPRATSCDSGPAIGNYAPRSVLTARMELGTGFLWSQQPGFYSSNQDANTWYTCEIGAQRKVKQCTFTDQDVG